MRKEISDPKKLKTQLKMTLDEDDLSDARKKLFSNLVNKAVEAATEINKTFKKDLKKAKKNTLTKNANNKMSSENNTNYKKRRKYDEKDEQRKRKKMRKKRKMNRTIRRKQGERREETFLNLGLINIENIHNKKIEIEEVINRKDLNLHVIGTTETQEKWNTVTDVEVKGFIYIGKPLEPESENSFKTGGTGIFMRKNIFDRVSIFYPEIPNENILWIQIHGRSGTCYIAVVYSKPNNIDNHNKVIDTPNVKL